MVTLDQVKQLDEKVTRAIEYVKKVTGENVRLTEENSRLTEKLDSCQKRIDELEVLVRKFKEDQSRIEDGILSALQRLNQFEDAVEGALSAVKPASGAETVKPAKTEAAKPAAPKPETETPKTVEPELPVETEFSLEENDPEEDEDEALPDSGELDIF